MQPADDERRASEQRLTCAASFAFRENAPKPLLRPPALWSAHPLLPLSSIRRDTHAHPSCPRLEPSLVRCRRRTWPVQCLPPNRRTLTRSHCTHSYRPPLHTLRNPPATHPPHSLACAGHAPQHVPAAAAPRRRPPAPAPARSRTAEAQSVQLHRRRHSPDRRRKEEHPRWHPQVGRPRRHPPLRAAAQ